MNIENIDLNGQSFIIRDGKAIHVDESDSLTEEEKAQARENIGAMQAPVDDYINLKYSKLDNVSGIEIVSRDIDGTQIGGAYICAGADAKDENGCYYSVIELEPLTSGLGVVITGLHDGISDHDAATVGQLKNATNGLESTDNRATTIDDTADDEHYPTTQAVNTYVDNNCIQFSHEQTLDANQQVEAMRNIGIGTIALPLNGTQISSAGALEFSGVSRMSIREQNDTIEQGDPSALIFEGHDDNLAILRRIADGVQNDDAATVGQLNAAVGDIEAALDELHNYAQALISGGATE